MGQVEKIDLGDVQIHKKVIADIIETAVADIDGVSLVDKKLSQKLTQVFGQEHFGGINIDVNGKDDVTLHIHVNVRYGLNIPDVAKQIQDTIKAALTKTVSINIKNINVNIEGIERG